MENYTDINYCKNNLMFLKGLEKGFTLSIDNKNSFDKIKQIRKEIENIESSLLQVEQKKNNTNSNTHINTNSNTHINTNSNNVTKPVEYNVQNINILDKQILILCQEEDILKNKIRSYQKDYKTQHKVYIKHMLQQVEIINNNVNKYKQVRNIILQNLNNNTCNNTCNITHNNCSIITKDNSELNKQNNKFKKTNIKNNSIISNNDIIVTALISIVESL